MEVQKQVDFLNFHHEPTDHKFIVVVKSGLSAVVTERPLNNLKCFGYKCKIYFFLFLVTEVSSVSSALKLVNDEYSAIVLVFAQSGQDTGMKAIQKIREKTIKIPLIGLWIHSLIHCSADVC
jgi:hypothetical protein